MITLFAIPKAFRGEFKKIQLRAIESWLNLKPRPTIVLFGNEEGISEVVKKYRIAHVRKIKRSKQGTPLLNDVFNKACRFNTNRVLVYANADIIIKTGLITTIKRATKKFSQFVIVGRRYDDMVRPSNLAPSSWTDYFVFTKGVYQRIPPFAIGRTFWDKWLMFYALTNSIPLIDATKTVTAIHQKHSYNHAINGIWGVWQGVEAVENVRLAGGWGNGVSSRYANYVSLQSRPYFKKNSVRFRSYQDVLKRKLLNILFQFRLTRTLGLLIRFHKWRYAQRL